MALQEEDHHNLILRLHHLVVIRLLDIIYEDAKGVVADLSKGLRLLNPSGKTGTLNAQKVSSSLNHTTTLR